MIFRRRFSVKKNYIHRRAVNTDETNAYLLDRLDISHVQQDHVGLGPVPNVVVAAHLSELASSRVVFKQAVVIGVLPYFNNTPKPRYF